MAVYCEHGDPPFGFIEGWKFLEQLATFQRGLLGVTRKCHWRKMKFHVCVIRFTVFEVFNSGHSNEHWTQTLVGENICLLMQAAEERITRYLEECRKPVVRESWKFGRYGIKSRDILRLLSQTVVGQKKVNSAIQGKRLTQNVTLPAEWQEEKVAEWACGRVRSWVTLWC